MGGTGIVPHCEVISSFVATMGKVSRAAAGAVYFRAVSQPFKLISTFVTCSKVRKTVRNLGLDKVKDLYGVAYTHRRHLVTRDINSLEHIYHQSIRLNVVDSRLYASILEALHTLPSCRALRVLYTDNLSLVLFPVDQMKSRPKG